MTTSSRIAMVDADDQTLSVRKQAELLGIHRSTLYYQPKTDCTDETGSEPVKILVDEVYTESPFYGSRRIAVVVSERLGRLVNRKQVQRLMRTMGIQAIGPSPSLSKPGAGHKVYPYLLRSRSISKPNEVWSTDITYVRLSRGFGYLTAVIDWYSRFVLAWRLSNTLDSEAPIGALLDALSMGAIPLIFNTDQGSQFTSAAFTDVLLATGIQISMDGRGRALDNIFVERLWRSVKYEDIYPKGYQTMDDARVGLEQYFEFYNHRRPHQALGYRRPAEVHYGGEDRCDKGFMVRAGIQASSEYPSYGLNLN